MNIINTCSLTYLHTCTHTALFYDCSDDSDGGSTDDNDDDDSSDDSDGDGSDDSLEGAAPTPKRRKHAREEALKPSLNSGRYPTFQGVEGPTNDLDPTTSSAFEYLQIVWPNSLCALETNIYAVQKGVSNWEKTTIAEMWTYLAIILLMGIHRLPRIKNYWSRDKFMGIPDLHRYMSSTRFWALWSNVDNQTIANTGEISSLCWS